MIQSDVLDKIEVLRNTLIARATGKAAEEDQYRDLRKELVADPKIKRLLPKFVITCVDLAQFWNFIKPKYSTYDERRIYLYKEFELLIEAIESGQNTPSHESISSLLKQLDVEHVHRMWDKSLERREQDPEAAITSARTLLESVCKYILDDLEAEYDNSFDLPRLYKTTAKQLNLAPDQHTEQVFKQILTGCQAVVDGLSSVRNKLSDAHGQGKKPVKPAPRHAELAVNLAGAMATFLVRTWELKKKNNS